MALGGVPIGVAIPPKLAAMGILIVSAVRPLPLAGSAAKTGVRKVSIIGAIAWVVLFAYAGYFFANTKIVKENLSLVLAAIIVLSVLPAVVEIVRAKRAAKKQNG